MERSFAINLTDDCASVKKTRYNIWPNIKHPVCWRIDFKYMWIIMNYDFNKQGTCKNRKKYIYQ